VEQLMAGAGAARQNDEGSLGDQGDQQGIEHPAHVVPGAEVLRAKAPPPRHHRQELPRHPRPGRLIPTAEDDLAVESEVRYELLGGGDALGLIGEAY